MKIKIGIQQISLIILIIIGLLLLSDIRSFTSFFVGSLLTIVSALMLLAIYLE